MEIKGKKDRVEKQYEETEATCRVRRKFSGDRRNAVSNGGRFILKEELPAATDGKGNSSERNVITRQRMPFASEGTAVLTEAKPISTEGKPFLTEEVPSATDEKPVSKEGMASASDAKPFPTDAKPPVTVGETLQLFTQMAENEQTIQEAISR